MSTLNCLGNPIIFQKWMNLKGKFSLMAGRVNGPAGLVQNPMQIETTQLREYKIEIAKMVRDLDVLKLELTSLSQETLQSIQDTNVGL